MDKNNPTFELVSGRVQALATAITENGSIGAALEREIEEIANIVIDAQWLYNMTGRQLRGTGARTNLLTYTTRRGWRARDKNAWKTFGINQAPSVLSENILVDKAIETSMAWNKLDMKDTEKGLEKLVAMLMSALTEELPVEYEKRYINMLRDVSLNGIDLVSDDIVGTNITYPTAFGYEVAVDLTDSATTQLTIDNMIELSIKMGQQENPIYYRPSASKFMFIINTNLERAINKAGGFTTFIGDNGWERALNNKPFKLLNNIPVMVSNELSDDQPFFIMPRAGAFNNIEFSYTTQPDGFFAREDFEGESATNMFYKIESGYFSMQVSYWAVKMGLFGYGKLGANTMKTPTFTNAFFVDIASTTGAVDITYQIDATNVPTAIAADYSMVLVNMQTYEETDLGTLVIDGTVTTITGAPLEALATGSYQVQMRDANNFNIWTTASYYIRNFSSVVGTNEEVLGDITNRALSKPKTNKIK